MYALILGWFMYFPGARRPCVLETYRPLSHACDTHCNPRLVGITGGTKGFRFEKKNETPPLAVLLILRARAEARIHLFAGQICIAGVRANVRLGDGLISGWCRVFRF